MNEELLVLVEKVLEVVKDKKDLEDLKIPKSTKDYLSSLIHSKEYNTFEEMLSPKHFIKIAWEYVESEFRDDEGLYYLFYSKEGKVFLDKDNYATLILTLNGFLEYEKRSL